MKPFTKNRFHYNWHWFWDTGNGDMGNQGIHEMDIARWGLGVTFPTKVSAVGGHFLFDDDQETPNTLNAAFEFKGSEGKRKMLEFEVRHWITNHEAGIGTAEFHSLGLPAAGLTAAAPKPKKGHGASKLGPDAGTHNTIGNLFYGSKGCMALGGYDSYKTWLGKEMTPGPEGHGGEFQRWRVTQTDPRVNLRSQAPPRLAPQLALRQSDLASPVQGEWTRFQVFGHPGVQRHAQTLPHSVHRNN